MLSVEEKEVIARNNCVLVTSVVNLLFQFINHYPESCNIVSLFVISSDMVDVSRHFSSIITLLSSKGVWTSTTHV